MFQPYASLDDLRTWARGVMFDRQPDLVIGDDPTAPYLRRWWIVPRNEFYNVYLHEILRSDDDRAGHDHPWANTSFLIDGEYEEVRYYSNRPWEEMDRRIVQAGEVVSRMAEDTHRLVVPEGKSAISLFITGPKVRDWGFWCENGPKFVPWQDFSAGANGERIGRGCGE